jgi:hypothetical protein
MGENFRKTAKWEPEKYTTKCPVKVKEPLNPAFAFFLDPIAWVILVLCIILVVIGVLNNVNPVDRSVVSPALSDNEALFQIVAIVTLPAEMILWTGVGLSGVLGSAGLLLGGAISIMCILAMYFLAGKLLSFAARQLFLEMIHKGK